VGTSQMSETQHNQLWGGGGNIHPPPPALYSSINNIILVPKVAYKEARSVG